MMYNLIPVLIIIFSLAIVIFLILRRIPEIKKEAKIENTIEKIESNDEILKPDKEKIEIKKPFFWRLRKKIVQLKSKDAERKSWMRSILPPPKPKSLGIKTTVVFSEEKETRENFAEKLEPTVIFKNKVSRIKKIVAPFKEGIRAGSRFFKKKSPAQTERELLNQLDLQPNDYRILKELSQFYIKRRKYEKAANTLRRLIEVRPTDFSSYGDFGFVSIKLNNYTDAVESYKIAVDHDPKNIEYLENLALIAEKLDNMPMVKATLERLLELKPRSKKFRARLKELERQTKLL